MAAEEAQPSAPASSAEANPAAASGEGLGRRREAESLGWLTESAIMPKRHRAIEGVGAGSILELKAQLYRTQEEARARSRTTEDADAFRRAKPKQPIAAGPFHQKNAGVEARDKKDKLELKAAKDGSASYAALERKAELYEKLLRRELPDEEEEKYCVDFFKKSLDRGESEQPAPRDVHEDRQDESEGDDASDTFLNGKSVGFGRTGSMMDKDEHKRFVREVHEEVNEARQMVSTIKLRRQEQEAARREKFKLAFRKKQLEKLLAAKQGAETGNNS